MTTEQINFRFLMFTIFWWCGWGLAIFLIGIPLMITSVVFGAMLLHQAWTDVQRPGLRTTPGTAIGFCFIPLFCFYWWFRCFFGISREYNEKLKSIGSPLRISEGLAIASCVLNIVGIIPYVAIFTLVPLAICEFLFVMQLKNALLEARKNAVAITKQGP